MKKEVTVVLFVVGFLFILAASNLFDVGNNENLLKKVKSSNVVGFASSGASCSGDSDCQTGYVCEGNVCSLGCLEDSECSEGKCNLETGRCVSEGCSSDSQCSGSTRWCDLSTSACVECYDQYHCSGDLVCNLKTNKCEDAAEQVDQVDKGGDDKEGEETSDEESDEEKVSEEKPAEETKEDEPAEEPADEKEQVKEEEKIPADETKTPTDETFTLNEGETKEVPLVVGEASNFKITLRKADNGDPNHELSYQLTNPDGGFGGSGNIRIGSKDVSLWSSISKSTYLMINPLHREGSSVTFRVVECKDLSCLDDLCPDYSYGETRFVKGSLSDWTKYAGSQRKLCGYEVEKTLEVLKADEEKYIDNLNADKTNNGGTLGNKYVAIRYEPQINYELEKIEFFTGLRSPSTDTYLLVQLRENDNQDLPKAEKIADTKFMIDQEISWQGTTLPDPVLIKSGVVYWIVIKVENNNPDVFTPMSASGRSVEYRGSDGGTIGWDGPYSNNWMVRFYGKEVEIEKAEETVKFYRDADQDDYGDKEDVKEAVSAPEGYVDDNTDCNDEDASVHPGADEIANDDVDQDCDGQDLVKAACEDSDGNDLNAAGTVRYRDAAGTEQTFTDRCIGLVGVLEGQCTEEGLFACLDETNCRRRCPEGQVCSEGACKATEAQCTDTDGEDRNSAGSVTFTDERGIDQAKITDSCVGYRFVKEAVCNFVNQGRTKVLKCEADEICQNGACVSSPEKCIDTDGKDRMVKGTTTFTSRAGTSGQFKDTCISNKAYVIEGICKVDTMLTRAVPCPAGTACSDGACVEGRPEVQFSCKDSDRGYNILQKGTATYTDDTGTHTKEDSCTNSGALDENYCYGTSLRTYTRACPSSYSCNDGACVKQQTAINWWRQ